MVAELGNPSSVNDRGRLRQCLEGGANPPRAGGRVTGHARTFSSATFSRWELTSPWSATTTRPSTSGGAGMSTLCPVRRAVPGGLHPLTGGEPSLPARDCLLCQRRGSQSARASPEGDRFRPRENRPRRGRDSDREERRRRSAAHRSASRGRAPPGGHRGALSIRQDLGSTAREGVMEPPHSRDGDREDLASRQAGDEPSGSHLRLLVWGAVGTRTRSMRERP